MAAFEDRTTIASFLATKIGEGSQKPVDVQQLAESISEVELETQTAGSPFIRVHIADPYYRIAREDFLALIPNKLSSVNTVTTPSTPKVTATLREKLPDIQAEFPQGSNWWWQLAAAEFTNDLTRPNIVLTFEDRIVTQLREEYGFVVSSFQTRAEFVKSLVDRANHRLRQEGKSLIQFVCPKLHELQEVEQNEGEKEEALTGRNEIGEAAGSRPELGISQHKTEEAARKVVEGLGAFLTHKAKHDEHVRMNKLPGIAAGANLTVAGSPMTSEQKETAEMLLTVADRLKAPGVAVEALVYAAIGESTLSSNPEGNLAENGERYWGVLSGSQKHFPNGAAENEKMVEHFLNGGLGFAPEPGGAIQLANSGKNDAEEIAVLVEKPSVWPQNAYAEQRYEKEHPGSYLKEADEIILAWGGVKGHLFLGSGSVSGESDVGQLSRGTPNDPTESTWDCVQRLAAQVRWSAFTNGLSTTTYEKGRYFYYLDGFDFIRQKPAATVDLFGNVVVDGHTGKATEGAILEGVVGNVDNCLACDTPLPTPDGWTTMGEVKEGDLVFASDGRPTVVLRVSETYRDRRCFRVCFDDGSAITTDASHLWETVALRRDDQTVEEVAHQRYRGVRSTERIAERVKIDGRAMHRVKMAAPLQTQERHLPVDPYLLGYWLGDGDASGSGISVSVEDAPHLLAQIEAAGYEHTASRYETTGWGTKPYWKVWPRPPGGGKGCADSMTGRLRDLGILGHKRIPALYLRASEAQRLALLQGLMDSDGCMTQHCCLQLADEQLASDALELILSLGVKAHWLTRPSRGDGRKTQYAINFASCGHLTPFRLPRKACRYADRVAAKTHTWADSRSIIAVEPVPSVPVRCIAVGTEDHLYLAGDAMIPTHNTMYEYYANHKVRGKVQVRRSAVTKPSTPAEIRIPMICEPLDYEAGDVFHIVNSGPFNGRWVVTDSLRNVIRDPYTVFTLAPPLLPYPEPHASASALAGHHVGVEAVAGFAEQALAERAKYVYTEAKPNRENNGTLFGNPPREMDCSAFATLCYKMADMPDPSHQNYTPIGTTYTMLPHMRRTNHPVRGDLVFYGLSETQPEHVVVYIGNGRGIGMQDPKEGIQSGAVWEREDSSYLGGSWPVIIGGVGHAYRLKKEYATEVHG